MTIIAISTTKASQEITNLTINSAEVINLVQMGKGKKPIRLNRGLNNVPVGRGVFKVSSGGALTVTADASGAVVLVNDLAGKDGSWPDPSALNVGAEGAADVTAFFIEGGMGAAV